MTIRFLFSVFSTITKGLQHFYSGSNNEVREQSFLILQVGDDSLLLVKPAGEGDDQKLERIDDVCHCQKKLSAILLKSNIIRLVRICAPYGAEES